MIETVITANPTTLQDYLKKMYKHKTLIWVFALRDIKVKYSQTILGLGWTLVQPLTALIIFSFFFGFLLHWEADGISYPLYILSGLLGWNFFTYTVISGTFGLQEAAHLIKKIYFPKGIIPFSKTLIALIELSISTLILIPLMLYYGQPLSWHIIFLPLVLIYNAVCAFTLVFWFSAFSYKNRDLLHLVPFLLYFGIWFTPIFFSGSILPEQYKFIINFNPMANVVQLWRWSLFGLGKFEWIWALNFAIVCLLFFIGLLFYIKHESEFSDYV